MTEKDRIFQVRIHFIYFICSLSNVLINESEKWDIMQCKYTRYACSYVSFILMSLDIGGFTPMTILASIIFGKEQKMISELRMD